MTNRLPALLVFTFAAGLSATAHASGAGQEYTQVRRIALRDDRVRDAFVRAHERLDAKIVALDPALAGYVRTHPSGQVESAPAGEPVRHPFRPAVAKAPVEKSAGRTHLVAAGETLSSIAMQYGVPVQKLQAANQIQDARKLRVGQTLAIP